MLSGLRHFLKLEKVFSGKCAFTTADGRNWKLTGLDIKFNKIKLKTFTKTLSDVQHFIRPCEEHKKLQ